MQEKVLYTGESMKEEFFFFKFERERMQEKALNRQRNQKTCKRKNKVESMQETKEFENLHEILIQEKACKRQSNQRTCKAKLQKEMIVSTLSLSGSISRTDCSSMDCLLDQRQSNHLITRCSRSFPTCQTKFGEFSRHCHLNLLMS